MVQSSRIEIEKDLKRRAVIAAIWLAIFLIVGGVFLFIIPEWKELFLELGTDLPKWIVVVIKTSDFVSKYWYAFIPPIFTALLAYVVVPALVRGRSRA